MALIDNEEKTLQDALVNALPLAERVDIATAYFYFSGFSALAEELKDKRIRILVGKTIDPDAISDLSAEMKVNPNVGLDAYQPRRSSSMGRVETKKAYTDSFVELFNKSALSESFDGTKDQAMQMIFEEKLRDGTLEIRMTGKQNHAKSFILMNKYENSQNGDYPGTVFMGSSNFTFNGLIGQGELNKAMRDKHDYEEQAAWFEKLWNSSEAIDIQTKDTPVNKDSFLNQIQERLWIHATPAPYKVFIRILHELYSSEAKDELETPYSITGGRYGDLKYQLEAVKAGVECIRQNNGVIIADVVGLGKSVIASAIAKNLDLRPIIIVPPHLISQWKDYASEFRLPGALVESGGKIEELHEKYSQDDTPRLFIIDEAHRYRNELTDNYQWLHQLTRSHPENKVILLTATPYNNKPDDLFALIKLFQTPTRSTISSVDNLGLRFQDLISQYKKAHNKGKKKMTPAIERELQDISRQLRHLIEPVVIRRSRIDLREIQEFADDLKAQNIDFPEVVGPELIEFDLGPLSDLYKETLTILTDADAGFKGARYQSTAFISDKTSFQSQYGDYFDDTDLTHAQSNLAKFMRRLLVQRFESSKFAFKRTLESMISSHEIILSWWGQGYVPIRKKDNLIDPSDLEDFTQIEELNEQIELGDDVDLELVKKIALPIPRKYFDDDYPDEVTKDLELLRSIHSKWFGNDEIGLDPKQSRVEERISGLLRDNPERKIVIFTGYSDTAAYVCEELKKHGFERSLLYTGSSPKEFKKIVSENFDASYKGEQKNDYDIIVATDALSEGFNLHRAGVIFNYDIPYNPTRVVQRIGRINRINQKMFDEIYIYNFFPTEIGEDIANVKGISTLKMLLINGIIGSDTKTLTEDEDLRSYFKRTYDEADTESSERSWDNEYRNIYDGVKHNHELIDEVLSIPERTRIVRKGQPKNLAISFAKRGTGTLFALAGSNSGESELASAEEVLPLFKASVDEESFAGDPGLDEKFEALRRRITAPHPLPRLHGRRADALKIVEFLKESYAPERDYLHDLYDSIREFDDLSEGELKFITQVNLGKGNETSIAQAVETLKVKLPSHYLSVIKERAEAVDSASEVIMFTEDLRENVK